MKCARAESFRRLKSAANDEAKQTIQKQLDALRERVDIEVQERRAAEESVRKGVMYMSQSTRASLAMMEETLKLMNRP